jgi:uncharacterized membrane protein YedE/YeeE
MNSFIEWIMQPWPPIVGGIMIGLTVPMFLLLTGKTFGISTSFRHLNAMCSPGTRVEYLRLSGWRENFWQTMLVIGVVIGAYLANYYLSDTPVAFLPESYNSLGGGVRLLIGGILIGFGTRWANGCTGGHTIMGISNLQWQSMVATVFFFVGGLITTFVFAGLL